MKTALVVGASNYNIKYIERIASQYDYIVACDKGAEAFLSAELTPNIIVGDFDSVDQSKLAQLKEKGISIKEYEIEKDFSDLELALIEVKDYDKIDFTGVLGGSISHELVNINVISRLKSIGKKTTIRENTTRIEFLNDGEVIKLPKGLKVSIVPFEDLKSNISLIGFRWNLDRHNVSKYRSLTLSNYTVDTAYVKNEGAMIMVIIEPIELKTR